MSYLLRLWQAEADGGALFEAECSACHGADDMAGLLDGWELAQIREALDKLEELNEEMVPFEGSAEEKDALSSYLYKLGEEN